jgi:hypothetical protein
VVVIIARKCLTPTQRAYLEEYMHGAANSFELVAALKRLAGHRRARMAMASSRIAKDRARRCGPAANTL